MKFPLLLPLLAALLFFTRAHAQPVATTNAAPAKPTPAASDDADAAKPSQASVAATNVTFAIIAKTDAIYTNALDAHDLDGGLKKANQMGAFKGKVAEIFESRDGAVLILNFDTNYREALCAVLRSADFARFPPMKTLEDKEVIVSGKFILYQGRPEVLLTAPDQIRLVQ
jgi:hypothetical protein